MLKMKQLFLSTALLLSTLLSGCQNQGSNKVLLSYGSDYDEAMTEVNYSKLLDMTTNGESFLLALRPGDESSITCSCWMTFSALLNNYVKNNLPIIYVTNVYQIVDYQEHFGLVAPERQDPGFALFKDGKLYKQYIYTTKNTPQFWQNKDALKDFIEEICEEPKMIYLQINQLSEMIDANKDKQIIASYVRKSCGDCGYVLPNVFLPYLKSHKINEKIYLIDLEDLGIWKSTMDETEKATYQAMKDTLKLSVALNETYGYGQGVVPTTFVHKGDQIIDANVFFNDTLSKDDDGVVTVTDSYFTNERIMNLQYLDKVQTKVLKGLTIPETDYVEYGEYIFWSQSAAAKYHTPLLNAFLDTYLK